MSTVFLPDTIRISTIRPVSALAVLPACCDGTDVLTEIYMEALLVDEELADQVWEAWDGGEWQILIFEFISL